MIDFEILTRRYFSKGVPCPYKLKTGIEIYIHPILVKDYEDYEDCKSILEIDKRNINDEKVISMSQLDFLEMTFSNAMIIDEANQITLGENELQKFKEIFSLCLHEDYVAITKHNGKNVVVVAEKIGDGENDFVVKYIISNKDYLNIVKIILCQNDVDYDGEYINPDVLKEYNEYMSIKSKGISIPSFEKQKVFVLSRYRCTLEELNNMTYRFFNMLLSEYRDIELYYINNMYKTSEKFDVKEDFPYPLYKPKEDRFKDLFMSTESLNRQLGN